MRFFNRVDTFVDAKFPNFYNVIVKMDGRKQLVCVIYWFTKWLQINHHLKAGVREIPEYHTHAYDVFAICLWGWYDHEIDRGEGFVTERIKFWNWMPQACPHRMTKVAERGSWTLFFKNPLCPWKDHDKEFLLLRSDGTTRTIPHFS